MATKAIAKVVLTSDQQAELKECIKIVQEGKQTAFNVGRALASINNGKLFRATHKSFAEFCDEIFGFKQSRAYQLIKGAKVADELSTMVEKPENERQARELEKAPAEERPAIMREAKKLAEDKPVTAAFIREIRENRICGARVKPAAESNGNGHAVIDPTPWTSYNDDIARMVELADEAAKLTQKLTEAQFGGWINAKQYKGYWKNVRTTFEKHAVSGWASDAEKKKVRRPFLYAHEAKKGAK